MSSKWDLIAKALDALVAPSFGSPGFSARKHTWAANALDVDLSSKVMVVTGANSGIGKVVARELARRGATVVMACRSVDRGNQARQDLITELPHAALQVEQVDVGDLQSVAAFVERLNDGFGHVDALIHNAGLLVDERQQSPQGFELTFAVHVLGPFLMTQLMVQKKMFASGSRVVFVSSGGMYTQRLNLKSLLHGPDSFDGTIAYAQAKRAQVILSRMWAEELSRDNVWVNAMHPGWADTPGVVRSLPTFHRLTQGFLRTPEEGADTVVWLAASPEAADVRGKFFLDRVPRSELSRDSPQTERALWSLCEDTVSQKA